MADEFQDRLRMRLDELGIRPAELARRMNKSRAAPSLWLKGTVRPPAKTMKQLASVLGCDETWLAYGTRSTDAAAVPVRGAVEHDVFRRELIWPESEWKWQPIVADPRYEASKLFAIEVRDGHMNRVIDAGDTVVCIEHDDDAALNDNQLVLVKHGSGAHFEFTIRRYRVVGDEATLVYETDNADLQAPEPYPAPGLEIVGRATAIYKRCD